MAVISKKFSKHFHFVSVGMSESHFWTMVDIFENNTKVLEKIKSIEVPEALFMYRAKFRKNLSFEALGANLAISKTAARRMFWTMVFEYFEIANQIPRLFVNPASTDEAKNVLFQKMYEGYDPLHQEIADSFHGRVFFIYSTKICM